MAVGFLRALVVTSIVVLSGLSARAGDDPPPGDRPPPGEEPPRNGQSPPDLILWIKAHPQIAYGIKWEIDNCSPSAYHVPEKCKLPFWEWTPPEQDELVQAFNDAWNWYYGQPAPFDNLQEDIPYPFANIHPNVGMDNIEPSVWIEAATARKLFLAWVAQNLVAEIGGHFPWSVLDYDEASLQILFDSAAIMARVQAVEGVQAFKVGTGNPAHFNYVLRQDNLSVSLIAPPRYTYAFLVENDLIGSDKQDTIRRLLYWLKLNASHFFGGYTYQNMETHWQYRGIPPISRIIKGTSVGAPFEKWGFAHWTAGCHGTNGFLREVLRAANIPVQIVIACDNHHSQAYFITEGLYLDHGDNPYNWGYRNTCADPLKLLIDEATYVDWFGSDPDNFEGSCENIGRRAKELAPAEVTVGYIAICN